MEADILLLSDSCQVVENKLFLLGGGWRHVRARSLPANHQMGVAVGILVDWSETNRRHGFTLEIRHDASNHVLALVEGEFEQGRAPGIEPGSQQRTLLAVNFSLKFERDGLYGVQLLLDGRSAARTSFQVVDESKPRIAAAAGERSA